MERLLVFLNVGWVCDQTIARTYVLVNILLVKSRKGGGGPRGIPQVGRWFLKIRKEEKSRGIN